MVIAGGCTPPVGVGIVGAGHAGGQHLDALAHCPDASAVALCDTGPGRSDALLSRGGERRGAEVRTCASLAEMLDDPRVELVAVATPPGTHFDLALEVIAAHRGVLLEKPPLLTSDELSTVLSAARAEGVAAGVMFQHRFRLPAAAMAAAWSPAAVAIAEVVRYRPLDHYRRDGWRTDSQASGGALLAHLGVHFLDMACQMLGLPHEVAGYADPIPGTDVDQRVAFTARFDGGAALTFLGTTALEQRAERLAVYDSGRSLTVTGTDTAYEVAGTTERFTIPTADLRTQVYSDVALAVREGRQPHVASLAAAAGVVAVLEIVPGWLGQERVA